MLTLTQLAITFLSGVLLLVIVLYVADDTRSGSLPYPPGPKRLPVIGNLLDIPSREEWLTYRKWSDETCSGSEVVHVDVVGTHVIIVNSIEAGNELFIKRSSIYSDRPPLPAVTRLIRADWLIAWISNGSRWRSVRRAFHRHLSSTEIKRYHPLEQHVMHCLLQDLLESPENFSQHLRHMAGKIILGIAYGIDVLPKNDPYVATAEKMLHSLSLATQSGGRLFSMIPWLIYMPFWFPGAGFKREAQKWIPIVDNTINEPYAVVQSALADGTAKYSVAGDMTSHLNENSTAEDVLLAKIAPANMYVGGADTTVAALLTFFMAMALYPEVQRSAQAEIDAVLGGSRLPEFSDESELPYVKAVVKEVFRWHPIVPLAIEHRVTQNDIYKGYFIPAGSTVIGNVWAMMYDPIIFPDPNRFHPERWLAPDAPAFPEQVFGFGRRECPGRFLAETSVWAAIANVLAVFKISPVEGDPPKRVYLSGVVSYPEPFRCSILPRSEVAAELVRATVNELLVE
ncbi:cytochrome P450 [Lactifluus volemus]|nr:cytochrome P450 [Lactifluus volemus]